MPTLLQRLKLRHKLAALSVVGVAMCLLPLIQVLRYQGLEISAARNAELGIDPALAAVELQRSLVAHRDAAAPWLRGEAQAGPLRQQRQREVDARLAALEQTLDQHGLARAIDEAQAMGHDWLQLVQRVLQRQLAPADSDAAHRLLVEQALQVIDFVARGPALLGERDPLLAELVRGLRHPLPQRTPAMLAAADDPALQAHWAAVTQAGLALRGHLAARREAAEAARAGLLGVMALLAAAALGLGLAVAAALRRLEHPAPEPTPPRPPAADGPVDGQTDLRLATRGLLAGMRDGPPAGPAPNPEPTRPAPLRED